MALFKRGFGCLVLIFGPGHHALLIRQNNPRPKQTKVSTQQSGSHGRTKKIVRGGGESQGEGDIKKKNTFRNKHL